MEKTCKAAIYETHGIPAEVLRVAELPLDDYAFVGHFDGMGMSQLVWSEPAADTRCGGSAPHLCSSGGGRPLVTTRPAVEDTEQRANRERDT